MSIYVYDEKISADWMNRVARAMRDPGAVIHVPAPSLANDHLTLSAAHRLLGTLKDETNSRAIHDECEDVMAKLSKIVEG